VQTVPRPMPGFNPPPPSSAGESPAQLTDRAWLSRFNPPPPSSAGESTAIEVKHAEERKFQSAPAIERGGKLLRARADSAVHVSIRPRHRARGKAFLRSSTNPVAPEGRCEFQSAPAIERGGKFSARAGEHDGFRFVVSIRPRHRARGKGRGRASTVRFPGFNPPPPSSAGESGSCSTFESRYRCFNPPPPSSAGERRECRPAPSP